MFILVWFERSLHPAKLSLNVKTDDVISGRRDLYPHGRLRAVKGGSGVNGLNILPITHLMIGT